MPRRVYSTQRAQTSAKANMSRGIVFFTKEEHVVSWFDLKTFCKVIADGAIG